MLHNFINTVIYIILLISIFPGIVEKEVSHFDDGSLFSLKVFNV
jgi:hypothetical protein